MLKCSKCGGNARIPFGCRYCGESFCHLRRIPMSHSQVFREKTKKRWRVMMVGGWV